MNPDRMKKYNQAKMVPEPDTMLRVKGQPFRCVCGSNVFTPYLGIYQCHGCDRRYF